MNAVLLSRLLLHIFLLALLSLPSKGIAQVSYGASGSMAWIKNPQRLPKSNLESDQEEELSIVSAGVQLNRSTQRFDTVIDYSAFRWEYADDLLSDQTRVAGNGSINWKIFPNVLNWQLTNSRSNQAIDVSGADTTDNRQVINRTSTGPILNLPMGSANLLQASAQRSFIDYEVSGFLDQERDSFSLGYIRLLSSSINLGVQSNFSEATFSDFSQSSYKTMGIFATASLTQDSYAISMEVGEHTTDQAGRKNSNPIFTLQAQYTVNSRIQLAADYSQSVQDLISDLQSPRVVDQPFQDSDIALENRFGNSNVANVYQIERAGVGIVYLEPSRYTVGLRLSQTKREIIGLAITESDDRFSATLQFPINPRLSMSGSFQASKLNFSQSARGLQERMNWNANASYRLSERLAMVISFNSTDQSGESIFDDFEGQSFSIGLSLLQ